MADNKSKDDFLDQFDAAMSQAYGWMSKKGYLRGVRCPICSGTDWLPEMRDMDPSRETQIVTPVFSLRDPRGHWGITPSVPALALSCTSCGFIRQHNLAILVDLVAEDLGRE